MTWRQRYLTRKYFLRYHRWTKPLVLLLLLFFSQEKPLQLKQTKTHTQSVVPRWNPPWCGEGAYLTKRFFPVHQQGELIGATQLRSSRINRSSLFWCQGLDSKYKNLDKSSFLIFSIFPSLVGFSWVPIYILYQYTSSFHQHNTSYRLLSNLSASEVLSLEMKYDIFRNRDEKTWQKHLE